MSLLSWFLTGLLSFQAADMLDFLQAFYKAHPGNYLA